MNNTFSRRDFIKLSLAAAAIGSMRIAVSVSLQSLGTIELVGYAIDETAIGRCITLGRTSFRDGKFIQGVSFDQDRALDAVTFFDADGNTYSYQEVQLYAGIHRGTTWSEIDV